MVMIDALIVKTKEKKSEFQMRRKQENTCLQKIRPLLADLV